MSCIHSGNDQDDYGRLKFEQQISEIMAEYIFRWGRNTSKFSGTKKILWILDTMMDYLISMIGNLIRTS